MGKVLQRVVLQSGNAEALKDFLTNSPEVQGAIAEGLESFQLLVNSGNPTEVGILSNWESAEKARSFQAKHPGNPLFGAKLASAKVKATAQEQPPLPILTTEISGR